MLTLYTLFATASSHLNKQGSHIVFMLWGNYAIKKGKVCVKRMVIVHIAPNPWRFIIVLAFRGSTRWDLVDVIICQS